MTSLTTIPHDPDPADDDARPAHDWPFVGRTAELAALRRSLDSGRSVLVVAEDGLGKSALARRAVADLAGSMPVIVLRGNAASRDMHYGAWASVLAQVPGLPWDDPIGMLRAVSAHLSDLAEAASSDTCLVVLDDVHWLDAESLQLAIALTSLGTARVLALSRALPRPPTSLLGLIKDEVFDRIDLEPLPREDVAKVVTESLGDTVTDTVLDAIVGAAAGNPLQTRELLADLRTQGVLVREDGTWVLDGPVTTGKRLEELVSTSLAETTDTQREAIDLISLAEPVDLSWLVDSLTSEVIDELSQRGWITVTQEEVPGQGGTTRPVVRLTHALYGETVRRLVSPARRLVLQKRLLDAAPPVHDDDHNGLLLRARWAVETGSPRPTDELVRAATAANATRDFALAVAIAERVVADTEDDPSDPARAAATVQLVHAHQLSGHPAAANAAAAAFDPTGSAPPQSLAVLGARIDLLLDDDRADEALELVDRARARASAEEHAVLARLRLLCEVQDLHWSVAKPAIEAEFQADGTDVAALDLSSLDDTRLRLFACYARGTALSGEPRRAVEYLRPALALLDGRAGAMPLSRGMVHLLHAATAVATATADWEFLDMVLRRLDDDAPRSHYYQGGSTQLIRATALVRTGRIVEALPALHGATSQLVRHDTMQMLPQALALGAYARSLLGDVPGTTELVDRALSGPQGADRVRALERDTLCAAASALTHGRDQAVRRLTELADELHRRGLVLLEAGALEAMVRIGDPHAAERLADVAGTVHTGRSELLRDYASALCHHDPAALLEVAARAEDATEPLMAAEAAAQASDWLAAEGRNSSSLRARNLAQRLLLANHGVATARLESAHLRLATTRDSPQAPLTAREHEIRTLARSGLTNPEIANRLSLSRRTVENHLYRIYLKLGVESRESL